MTTHVCGGFTEERPLDEEAAAVDPKAIAVSKADGDEENQGSD